MEQENAALLSESYGSFLDLVFAIHCELRYGKSWQQLVVPRKVATKAHKLRKTKEELEKMKRRQDTKVT